MQSKRKKNIFTSVFLSLILHSLILLGQTDQFNFFEPLTRETPHKNVLNIRTIGEEYSKKKNLVYLPQKKQAQKNKPKLKNLAFKPRPITPPGKKENQIDKKSETGLSTAKKTKLHIADKQIKNFLKTPAPGFMTSGQALQALADTNVNIDLEVPKGIHEDELNQKELVFYSFQKRTIIAYINSFQKELNEFELKNPHKRFPLTQNKQKMAGRVVYDKNGDILRIQTLEWSRISDLQNFFMNVLKNMSSLPNPPHEILEDDQFAINFVLVLNNN